MKTFKIRKRILGKVDLQKTIYFMKRLGGPIPFEFRWNILGPYSYDLAHYCDHLAVEGLFRYSGRYVLEEKKAMKYVSNLKSRTRRRFARFFKRLEETCNEHSFDPVSFIECAASLDFIANNVSKKNRKKTKVYALMDALKPEKAELFRTFREYAWNLLGNEGLVQ